MPFESSSFHLTTNWNESVDEYIKENGVDIEFINDVPSEFAENQILLNYSEKKDKDSKSFCFFRHIRNAKAHNRIWKIKSSNVIQARDVNPNSGKTTMVLQCSFDFLKGLIFRLLETSPFQTMDDINDFYNKNQIQSKTKEKKKDNIVLVYHYTNFDSFSKMFKGLLDQNENTVQNHLLPNLSIRLTAIKDFIEANRDDESMFSWLNNQFGIVSYDNGQKWNISKKLGNPYIFCLSDYGDNKGLWNDYAANNTGVVIGFAYKELLKQFVVDRSDSNFYFTQCHYITKNQRAQRVLQFEAELKKQNKLKVKDFFANTMRDILRCKASKYKDERETRMLYFSPSGATKYEFIEMPIALVRRIIIGKQVSSENESMVRELVSHIKRALNVEIIISKVTT